MVTRVNGFSGMDIDSMVKNMMNAKRVPLEKLNQDKQLLEWKREGYRELNSRLYDFRTNKLGTKYGSSSALNANKAVVTGNTDAVKAEATSMANGIEMKISVTQLATRTTYSTPGLGQGITGSTSLAKLDNVDLSIMTPKEVEEYLNKGFDIKINGADFKDKNGKSLFNGSTSISTLVATINSNEKANAIASFDEITGKLTISAKDSGEGGTVEIVNPAQGNALIGLFSKTKVVETNGLESTIDESTTTMGQLQNLTVEEANSKKYNFSINGKSFNFDANTTIANLVKGINDQVGANVIASFDGKKLKIVGKDDGAVVMGGGSYELLKMFKGTVPKVIGNDAIEKVIDGKNAQVTINGEKLDNIKSNTFTINGFQLTLLKATIVKDSGGTEIDTPLIVKNQSDPEKVLETIKGFIEDYNDLIKMLNTKVDEAKFRDFKPLTDEQKKELKEDDIKSWTEKAKSGLFKNDDIMKTVLSEMRMVITQQLGPLGALGITTGKYMENGKLILEDETKLKKAISANPQIALDLFQGPASASDSGLFDKLAANMTSAIQKISDRAGTNRFTMDLTSSFKEESVMGRTLKDYNRRIGVMNKNLVNAENRYYKQFTAMETAMSKLQSQSSSLLSSLGLSS